MVETFKKAGHIKNESVREFYYDTLPSFEPARQWFEEFYKRVQKCPLDKLEKRTSQEFTKYVMQEAWGFWIECVLDRAIYAVTKSEEQTYSKQVNWYHRVKTVLRQSPDDPLLAEKMLNMLESGTLPAFKTKRKRDKKGRPSHSSKEISEPSLLATKLIERARSDTRKPHWEVFAEILHILFPNEFLDNSAENLRRRVSEFQRRHNLSMKKDRK